MSRLNTRFYPMITSPFIKLLQLGAGVLMMFLLLNQLFFNVSNNHQAIDKHFSQISNSYIQQSVDTAILLLANRDNQQLQGFVEAIAGSSLVKDAVLYDESGQIIAQSTDSQTIRQLYGLEQGSNNTAPSTLSVVEEIRTNELLGFIRLTMNEKDVNQELKASMNGQAENFRIIFVLAIIVGFLLTRGFERFTLTKHGFRVIKANLDAPTSTKDVSTKANPEKAAD